jgi:exportin-5
MIAPLLEICSSRLIRYEALPEGVDDPCMLFLLDDIDTVPERHAFLGNYRRYSVQVIELIVRRKQSDAIYHILSQVGQTMQHLYDGYLAFSIATYSKSSTPILRVDAQFTVVEAALKGYMKWRQSLENKSSEEQINLENNFEVWCNQLLEMKFEDPIIRKRILQLAVAFSTSVLDKRSHFMLTVLEHILMSTPVDQPGWQPGCQTSFWMCSIN